MKIFSIFLILPVLLSSETFQVEGSPYTIPRHIQYSYTIRNKSNHFIKKAEFWAYGPIKESSTQKCEKLKVSHPYQAIQDKSGNQILYFQFKDIPPFGTVLLNIEADILFSTQPVQMTEDISTYLKPGKNIQSDEPEIKKAAEIFKTENSLRSVEKIFEFVSNHIEYTGYQSQSYGALYALKQRKGDCTEFMDLFIALCRANAIPARGLGGYYIKESSLLQPNAYHNWAEFYYKGAWHTADPQRKIFMPPGGNYIGLRIISGSSDDFLDADEQFRIKGENLEVKVGG
jgi:transglutaminase-like putative cysteine protease